MPTAVPTRVSRGEPPAHISLAMPRSSSFTKSPPSASSVRK
ncbi:MAG TPA: hypothetical protein VFU21_08495 [Kofleriaceae bacterium]|nr:hypothetical protein [Kofleriaceae bacterium]